MPSPAPTLEDFGLDKATVRYYAAREWSWVTRVRNAHTRAFGSLWLAGGLLAYAGLVGRSLFGSNPGVGPVPDPAQRWGLVVWGCGLAFPLLAALAGFCFAAVGMLAVSLAAPLVERLQFAFIARSGAFQQASAAYQAYLDACQTAGVERP